MWTSREKRRERKRGNKENNIEGGLPRGYMYKASWEIEVHCRLAEGVSENTVDLWGVRGAKRVENESQNKIE